MLLLSSTPFQTYLTLQLTPTYSRRQPLICLNPGVGNSLLALTELGQSMGYELIATTTFNAIFLRSDFMQYLPEYDRSIQALHVPHMTTEIFQTYEGAYVNFNLNQSMLLISLISTPP